MTSSPVRRTILAAFLCALLLPAQASRRAPGFSLPDQSGLQHDLLDYRGKFVLLDFMKTDCPHCLGFSRLLEKMKAKYAGRVSVLSVVLPPDTIETVRGYLSRNKFTGPVLFDCGQMSYSYIRPSSPQISLPHLFIVGPEGNIRREQVWAENARGLFEDEKVLSGILDRLQAGK